MSLGRIKRNAYTKPHKKEKEIKCKRGQGRNEVCGIRDQRDGIRDPESESKNWDQSNFLKIGTQLYGHRYFGRGERC